jgi:proteasome assembly chaperone (PAC2) family protein
MHEAPDNLVEYLSTPKLDGGTLIMSFSGWMDGGDASTGTVERLVSLLNAKPFASIDAEPFYILNFPGSMEIASIFRPEIDIEDGLVRSIDMPRNRFYVARKSNLLLFRGKEPNMRWRTFGDCIFKLARDTGVSRLVFVGSFGGAVPHTREPRMYVTCSEERLHADLENVGLRRTGYAGPGSFMTYLLTQAPSAGLEMVSLIAEIPGYLQGPNPFCIEAITRRLSKILHLSLDLDSLRTASNEWEVEVTNVVEENDEMLEKIRELEHEYDTDLLEQESDESAH